MKQPRDNSRLVIAIDFDGTVVTHRYPEIGIDIGAVPVLKKLNDAGHKLILYTMRSGQFLDEAIEWFDNNGINLYAINTNPTQRSWTKSPKCYANLYIDDAALGIPLIHSWIPGVRPYVDWRKIELMLIDKGIIV